MKEYFFEDLYNNSKDLIQSISPQGKFLYVNQAWLKAFDYKLSDIKNMDVFSIVHPDSYDDFKKIFEQIMSKETAKKIERITFIKEDGAQIYLEGNISSKFIDHDPAYMRCFFKDITKRVKTEQNLQVLNYITQKLYETNDLDKAYTVALDKVCELDYVDIASIYLVDKTKNEAVLQDHRNLSKEYLEKASRIPFSKGITWKVVNSGKILHIRDIQKSKELGQAGRNLGIRSKDINFSIPFCLILNELVSNAFKHAFPNNNNGNILIKFECNSIKEMILTVNDDGVGLPKNIDIYKTQSMGMQLISALAVQLNAKIRVNRSNGTLFKLRFLNK